MEILEKILKNYYKGFINNNGLESCLSSYIVNELKNLGIEIVNCGFCYNGNVKKSYNKIYKWNN